MRKLRAVSHPPGPRPSTLPPPPPALNTQTLIFCRFAIVNFLQSISRFHWTWPGWTARSWKTGSFFYNPGNGRYSNCASAAPACSLSYGWVRRRIGIETGKGNSWSLERADVEGNGEQALPSTEKQGGGMRLKESLQPQPWLAVPHVTGTDLSGEWNHGLLLTLETLVPSLMSPS